MKFGATLQIPYNVLHIRPAKILKLEHYGLPEMPIFQLILRKGSCPIADTLPLLGEGRKPM